MNRAERRALQRQTKAWLSAVRQRPDLPEDVKDFAPIVADTAVRTGGSFSEADVLDTLDMLEA